MSRLVEGLSRFFGRVEILARGADDDRRAAEEALHRGHHLEARRHARALLARVPSSPIGLALFADASEPLGLDDDVVAALSRLCTQVPWRADVWLRLGTCGERAGWPHARDAIERAAAASGDRAATRAALLWLCDRDLHAGDPERALRWLERVPGAADDAELSLRRAECALWGGDPVQARAQAARLPPFRADGRVRLVRAQLAARFPDDAVGEEPVGLALGAYLLEAPGAEGVLTQLVAGCRDAVVVGRARAVLVALGVTEEPQWRAAFARAEGRLDEARQALLQGVREGKVGAAASLLALAVESRDLEALRGLGERHPEMLSEEQRLLVAAAGTRDAGAHSEALDMLEAAAESGSAWAASLLERTIAAWLSTTEADWPHVIAEAFRALCRRLDHADLGDPVEALGVELRRPLYVALLGEFNAGKSTLLNALLGTDVAPTGVRPTTATVHWVAWAPDPFARIVVQGHPDRVVSHADLKQTLAGLDAEQRVVDRVFIYAPIERLKRIELLDTPGFNAPNTAHGEAARAGIAEAHLALWLLDATAPLKHTERARIEEVSAMGVPVQILVNKRDRIEPDELSRVMAYIEAALIEVGLHSYRPPVALSARLALAARLDPAGEGAAADPIAPPASGWDDVERLLSEEIVNRADALRERALRRKAGRVTAVLLATAQARAESHAAEVERTRAAQAALRQLATRLDVERVEVAASWKGPLAAASDALAADIKPIAELPSHAPRDDGDLRAYVVERSVARFVPPVRDGVVALWQQAHASHEDVPIAALVAGPVRATLGGAAAACRTGVLSDAALLASVEAALRECADALRAHAASWPLARSGGALTRVAALHAALEPQTG